MRLPAPDVVPPIVLTGEPLRNTPFCPLPIARVPEASVPILLP